MILPFSLYIQGIRNKKTSFFSFTLFLFLFSFFYFLSSHTVSAVGFRMWEKNINTSPDYSSAVSVVVDSTGSFVYVAGNVINASNANIIDWRIEKRRVSDGAECALNMCGDGTEFGVGGTVLYNSNGRIKSMKIGPDGNLYVVGYGTNASVSFPILQIYNPTTGSLVSGFTSITLTRTNSTYYMTYGLVQDITFVGSEIYLIFYRASFLISVPHTTLGNINGIWGFEYGAEFPNYSLNRIITDDSDVYVVGYETVSGNNTKWRIDKINGWNKAELTNARATAVTVNGNNLYVGGYDNQGGRLENRLTSTGELTNGFGTTGVVHMGAHTWVNDMKVSSDGAYLYVVGGRKPNPSNAPLNYEWLLQKYQTSNGQLVWEQRADWSTTDNGEDISSIALASQTGYTDPIIYTAGYDKIGGTQNWRIEKTAQEVKAGDVIRAAHVQDLSKETLRRRFESGTSTFTFSSQVNTGNTISYSHVKDLRDTHPFPACIQWQSGEIASGTPIRAQHLNEISENLDGIGTTISINPLTNQCVNVGKMVGCGFNGVYSVAGTNILGSFASVWGAFTIAFITAGPVGAVLTPLMIAFAPDTLFNTIVWDVEVYTRVKGPGQLEHRQIITTSGKNQNGETYPIQTIYDSNWKTTGFIINTNNGRVDLSGNKMIPNSGNNVKIKSFVHWNWGNSNSFPQYRSRMSTYHFISIYMNGYWLEKTPQQWNDDGETRLKVYAKRLTFQDGEYKWDTTYTPIVLNDNRVVCVSEQL